MLMLLCILFQLQYNSINIYLNMVVIHFLLETIFTDCCLSFCPFFLLVIVLSVLLRYTIMIAPWVSFGHCVVCPSSIYGLWLPLGYLLAIVLSVLLRYTDYDCPLGNFWSLCCLSFFDIRIMIAPWVSFGHCVVCPSSIYGLWLPLGYLLVIVLSVLLRFTNTDYPYCIFKFFWQPTL